MPHHCCVPHCTSDSRLSSCKELSFHNIPQNPELRKRWIANMRRDVGQHFNISKGTRVCSKHFNEDAYDLNSLGKVRRRLKKDAIPTLFSWTTEKPTRRKLLRPCVTIKLPEKRTFHNEESSTSMLMQNVNFTCDHSYASHPEKDCNDKRLDTSREGPANLSGSSENSLVNVECGPSPDKNNLLLYTNKLLRLRNEEKFSILRFCNSDNDIKYYTGFSSYQSLDCFLQFLSPECNFLYYVGTENTSAGTPYELLTKRGPSRSLSPMEELFITLIRLRKGLQEKLIADLYSLSPGHVSKIINTWIIFLSDRLRCLPIWPGKEHVQKHMPPFFKESYSTTRAIVDCTEIFIEHPSAADCQRETFSSYKHHNTAKGLLAISPDGQITFISPLYAGRCSDKKIIRHCGFLDLIEDGDGVMVDRGFDIEEDLEKRGASLIMPSFLSGQDQFISDQLKGSRSIAAVRVHVERAVHRVKEFEILKSVPITLCPMLEKIWIICGHLANFTGTLFKAHGK